MRKDKKENVDKVSAELVKDPFTTARQLVEKTGLGLGTAHRAIKDVERTGTKDDRIINLTETDLDIVRLAQMGILEKLTDEEERKKMRGTDLAQIAEKSEKRYTIFRGSVTDDQGGLKSISEINLYDEEI